MSEPIEDLYFLDSDDVDECCDCDGSGWFVADCFEDTCCCLDPETEHGIEPCPTCNPEGRL